MPLYYAGKKIRDRGTNSGLFYAGKFIKNSSVVGGHDKHFSIPNKITLDDNGYFVTYKDGAQEVWRISIKFQLSNVNADQRLFGVVATPCPGVVIGVLNGKLNYWLSSDGVNWDIASRAVGLNTLTANTIYTLHFKRLKNTSGNYSYQCMLRSSVDNAWVNDIFISNDTPIKSGFYYNLGRDWGIFTENATFYLDSDTYITKGNSRGREIRLWSATSEGVVPVQGISKVYLPCFIKMYNKPSFNKNIGSGFTDNDFFTVGEAWQTLSTADNFEIVMKVTTGNDIASQQYILVGTGSAARSIVVFLAYSRWVLQLSSEGTSYDICDKLSTETPLPNTTYWFKLKFTGSRYVLSISTDGISFKGIIVAESSAKVYNAASYDLGAVIGATNWYWRGSIDFSGCYVNMNGGRAWDYTSTRFKTLVYDFQKT
jgi:hypothetical protein